MGKVRSIGNFHYQMNWDWNGWFYLNQKNEKIQMNLFIGSVTPPENDTTLYQFILGPFMFSCGWAK